MGLKPSTVEQVKFEYSPLGKIFNKGLDKDDEKEGLFKRLEQRWRAPTSNQRSRRKTIKRAWSNWRN